MSSIYYLTEMKSLFENTFIDKFNMLWFVNIQRKSTGFLAICSISISIPKADIISNDIRFYISSRDFVRTG